MIDNTNSDKGFSEDDSCAEPITAVLVDTCAFREANNDFIGISSSLLPSFFSVIKEKGLILLTHPVLERELEKHVSESSLCKNYQSLIDNLNKCKSILDYAKFTEQEVYQRIIGFNIKEHILNAYNEVYENAERLEFVDPATIFDLYFQSKPPFANAGSKKHEFPDAFVIEAVKHYLDAHPNDTLMVVSSDADWENALKDFEGVTVYKSISAAIKRIHSIKSILSDETITKIYYATCSEILSTAQDYIQYECYEIEDYELIDNIDIRSAKAKNVDYSFIPLKITRDTLLLETTIMIEVSGFAEVFDEYNSIWDKEENEYLFRSYADLDFSNGTAEIECEVQISFDFDSPEDCTQVVGFKLKNNGNIVIHLNDANISTVDADEMALRSLREDKGYGRINK